MTEPHPRSRAAYWLTACALALAVLLIYLPGLEGGFVFDDEVNIASNPALSPALWDAGALWEAAFSSASGPLGRPLSMLSFSLNAALHGMEPWGFKLGNLLLHLLNGALLWWLLRLLFLTPVLQARLPAAQVSWLALALTALWLAHPLNLTTVLYVVQRMTSLATLFTLLGLIGYLHARLRMQAGRPGMALLFGATLLCTAAALLSKESGVLLPRYALLLEALLFRFQTPRRSDALAVRAYGLIFVALPALSLAIFLAANPDWLEARYAMRPFTLEQRLLTESRVLVEYLGLSWLPAVSRLSLYHDDFPISQSLWAPPGTLAATLVVLSLGALVWLLRRRAPLAALGCGWFLVGHLLESTLLPLEIMHEHRNYLPGLGPLLVLAAAALWLGRRLARPAVAPALLVSLALAFGGVTWVRAQQWSHPLDHAALEAHHRPGSARAQYALGRLLLLAYVRGGEPTLAARAERAFHRAADNAPGERQALFALVHLAYARGEQPAPDLVARLSERLAEGTVEPSMPLYFRQLVRCAKSRQCPLRHDHALQWFQAALSNPALAESQALVVMSWLGVYMADVAGDFRTAEGFLQRVVELSPEDPVARLNLVGLHLAKGELTAARRELDEARASDPFGRHARRADSLAERLLRLQRAQDPDRSPAADGALP